MENAYVSVDEKELLNKVAKGDKIAFKTLHHIYWNDLHTSAFHILKNRDLASDIIQDVFIKLWIRRESLPSIDHFKSYLFIATRNEVISALRKKLRIELLSRQYDNQEAALTSPDDTLIIKDLESFIGKAISTLPPQQQMVYELTRKQGLSHEEIAQELGIAKKTVSNNITKALYSLRRLLAERGDFSV